SVLAANQLYTRCERCLPPIGLLDSTRWSVHRLFHWSRQILPRLDPQFRIVLVARLDRVNAALHIRPMIDGCYLMDGVFIPRTSSDYDRLRVPPHRCSLYGITLNVAANKVFIFVSSLK